jgi:hypothetical protein
MRTCEDCSSSKEDIFFPSRRYPFLCSSCSKERKRKRDKNNASEGRKFNWRKYNLLPSELEHVIEVGLKALGVSPNDIVKKG